MPLHDTLNAFYQWDSLPYPVETPAPDPGMATDSAFGLYIVPQVDAVHDTLVRTSLFEGHGLRLRNTGLLERVADGSPVWVFVLLVLLVALATLYFRMHKLRLRDVLASLVDVRAMDRMLRNTNMARTVALLPAGLLMLAGLALPVHQMALAATGIGGYLLLLAALTAFYLLRNGVMRLLATAFDDRQAVGLYITSNYLFHLTLAILMLPLLFLQAYLPVGADAVRWVMAGLAAIEFVVRLVRGMNVFLTNSSCSHLYLFYYLCTVEIVPILVLVKWFLM